jgi:hypothetical protein
VLERITQHSVHLLNGSIRQHRAAALADRTAATGIRRSLGIQLVCAALAVVPQPRQEGANVLR